MTFTVGSLFCGIGGFCFGFEEAGFKTIWANDFDAEAHRTYKLNFPNVNAICEDIRRLNASEFRFEPVDVLHAGFPCQSFSQAGNRLGFKDERGLLFFEIIKLIKRLGSKKPKILVFENSPFLMTGNGGMWFETIRNEIQKAGYWFNDLNAIVIDSRRNAGLPQRRERLFMVATARDCFDYNPFRGPVEKVEPQHLIDLLDLGRVDDEFYHLSEQNKYGAWISKEAKKHNDIRLFQLRKIELRPQPYGLCPTLTANMGAGGHNVPFLLDNGRLRKLTERECLRLQGFPERFKWPELSHGSKYRLIGNAVSPPVAKLLANFANNTLQEETNENRLGIPA
jgi:DNA (cytosine-5)-methyltransferase 1